MKGLIIVDEELSLIKPSPEDIIYIAQEANDPDVCKYMLDFSYPYSYEWWKSFLSKAATEFNDWISYNFVICKKGIPIGMVWLNGLNKQHWFWEVSYRLGKRHWWKWIMKTVLQSCLQVVPWELEIIVAKVNENNTASISLLKKIGFKECWRIAEFYVGAWNRYDCIIFSYRIIRE